MYFIWYNPDLDLYQKGTMKEYDSMLYASQNRHRFDVIYEFTNTSNQLVDKVLAALNSARKLKLSSTLA